MDLLITDPGISRKIIRQRRLRGIDQKDEVWEGVYVMAPPPNNEHQGFIGKMGTVFTLAIEWTGLGLVLPGVGITDRNEGWTKNFRVPDVSVFLNGTSALNKKSHWYGGPDFAVEIISDHDRSREKFDFYARVGVKELLLVDRDPWALELYRLKDSVLNLVGKSDLADAVILKSQVIPLSFQIAKGEPRPSITILHSDGVQRWSV
jgi:Uma2 family endonuclease